MHKICVFMQVSPYCPSIVPSAFPLGFPLPSQALFRLLSHYRPQRFSACFLPTVPSAFPLVFPLQSPAFFRLFPSTVPSAFPLGFPLPSPALFRLFPSTVPSAFPLGLCQPSSLPSNSGRGIASSLSPFSHNGNPKGLSVTAIP